MKIYRCVQVNQLNQGFGVENTPPNLLPTYTALGFKGHTGWDWGVRCKDFNVEHGGKCDPVYYDLDVKGVVTSIQQSDAFGFGVVVRTEDSDGAYEHLWWHFDVLNPAIQIGKVLESADPLGISGRTGKATGDHVHRELRPLIKDSLGNYSKSQINNGYGGAVSPQPFFINQFVVDVVNQLEVKVGLLQKLIALVKQLLGLK